MPAKSLAQWLAWMEETRPEHEIDFGLERIRQVGERLSLLKPAPFTITVGGTNGKGSTLAVLEAILLAAGYQVGLFTSPHFLHFNERIRINGEPVRDDWLCDAFDKINSGRQTTPLSYFEFATLAAVDCFARAQVDIALMEVGLGGRLDATNVIDPDVAVITTVALDHQEYLGFSIEAIAREKAGIFRRATPAIYGADQVPVAVTQMAERLGATLYCRGDQFDLVKGQTSWRWQGVDGQGQTVTLSDLPVPAVVIDNAATALQALQLLPIAVSCDALASGLARVAVTGRFQKMMLPNARGEPIEVRLDVAHNPQAADMLRHRLHEFPVTGKTHAVVAVCKDKDYMAVVDCLADCVDQWYLAQFDSPRALPVEEFTRQVVARAYPATGYQDVIEALNQALAHSQPGDRVLVMGSFMTVGAVLAS